LVFRELKDWSFKAKGVLSFLDAFPYSLVEISFSKVGKAVSKAHR